MHHRRLQAVASECADELPGARLTHPFGEDWDVCTVRDKVVMVQTNVNGEPAVILKADPGESKALPASHHDVTPGYHMNTPHWITVHPGGDLSDDEVDELVTESYRLVVAALPRADQPVDPQTFGQRV